MDNDNYSFRPQWLGVIDWKKGCTTPNINGCLQFEYYAPPYYNENLEYINEFYNKKPTITNNNNNINYILQNQNNLDLNSNSNSSNLSYDNDNLNNINNLYKSNKRYKSNKVKYIDIINNINNIDNKSKTNNTNTDTLDNTNNEFKINGIYNSSHNNSQETPNTLLSQDKKSSKYMKKIKYQYVESKNNIYNTKSSEIVDISDNEYDD